MRFKVKQTVRVRPGYAAAFTNHVGVIESIEGDHYCIKFSDLVDEYLFWDEELEAVDEVQVS